jgi:hypothetical protein
VLEARADRRSRSDDHRDPDGEDSPSQGRLVRVRPFTPTRSKPIRSTVPERSLNPPGLLVLLIGLTAGWTAIDRVRAIDMLAGFIRTDGAAQVVRLGFSFAALLWVGAALAPVAPRGAAIAFAVAGAIGAFLAMPSQWERRLEWWGAGAVLHTWDHRAFWAGGAFVLSALALAAGRYRREGSAVRAASSAQAERIV